MDFPLTVTHYLERAGRFFGQAEVVWRRPDKSVQRQTYAQTHARAAQLANALTRLGVKQGDRVATLCWNHNVHLEAYLGVPAMGAVVHTLNLRLHPNELGYIANHAQDMVVIVDRCLLPLFAKFKEQIKSLKHVVVVPDTGPATAEEGLDYEKLIANEPKTFDWPALDEKVAAMLCYTSGTTGNPKGVLLSHRSTVLHTMSVCSRDGLGVGEGDVIMPVVPMFHAAAWGLPYGAVAAGANLVFPGPHLDPESLLDLMAKERVTFAGGVPTIWLGILAALDKEPKRFDLSAMRNMVIGGSAAPASLIDGFASRHGVEVLHAWGMTETSPLGTVCRLRRVTKSETPEQQLKRRAMQGYAAAFIETRHVDDAGKVLPWDGEAMGELEVRGPWVASGYFGGEGKDRFTQDGWFKTGDVVTIDRHGYVQITDRSKDVIKSGGEWISSVALENALMAHPKVMEAAVFAGKHLKWDERPIAAIVLKKDAKATDAELLAHLKDKFPHFWMPEAFVYLEQIPRTSTGKFLKSALREAHGGMLLTAAKG
ncbi:MAG: long-chain fatty acid--CoA ligase [Myxococcaceae bacterium]